MEMAGKILPVAFAFVLLLPFAVIFWRMTCYKFRTADERRAEVGQMMSKGVFGESISQASEGESDGSAVGGMTITVEERVPLSRLTGPWVAFYPRKWVGICGLFAVGVVFLLIVVSALFPVSPASSVSVEREGAGTPTDSVE